MFKSQEELAKKLGIKPQYLSKLKNGIRNPSYKLAKMISIKLDVPVIDVMEDCPSVIRGVIQK